MSPTAILPGVYDPTDPAGGSYYRGVLQIGANGAMQVTPTNTYPGNNGRAAILANGLYYLVGNSNNGSGTPANVVGAGGVQLATPGQSQTTAPLQIGNFSITQLTNPATGMPYAADKLGKDNNYRGLTIFNNTLYVTKGSGSNGMDTVYQVGTAGTLPTAGQRGHRAHQCSARLSPGDRQDRRRGQHLSVRYLVRQRHHAVCCDEGDGVAADAAGSTYRRSAEMDPGKWHVANGLCSSKGLEPGRSHTACRTIPAALNPATDGLRNITGRVNADGTVTIWAVTSTVSTNGDQGADPNKLVTITDCWPILPPPAPPTRPSRPCAPPTQARCCGAFLDAFQFNSDVQLPLILSAASPSVTGIAPGGLAFA